MANQPLVYAFIWFVLMWINLNCDFSYKNLITIDIDTPDLIRGFKLKAPGLLKMCMLKTISMGDVSGYQIIKSVETLTGKKPSAGSVYPLLKTMQDHGWIIGKKDGNKIFYEITDQGKEIIQKHDLLKEHITQKVRESILLAHNTVDDFPLAFSKDYHLTFIENLDLLSPLLSEISKLQANGVEQAKIKEVILKAKYELQKLKPNV